jgi:uncharacterized SAM-binding protein YcdF (DUF218 family)
MPQRRRIAIALLLGGTILLGYCAAALDFARRADTDRVGPARYDAIAILFGDFGERDGLSAETRRRLERAHALYRAQRARQLVCVGGGRPSAAVKGAELMCQALAARGVPASALRTESGSVDTHGNLADLSTLAREKNWRRVLLVSSPTHLHRIHRQFQEHGADIAWGYAPYHYADAVPAVSPAGIVGQVSYEWALGLLAAALPPARVSALAAWLRR